LPTDVIGKICGTDFRPYCRLYCGYAMQMIQGNESLRTKVAQLRKVSKEYSHVAIDFLSDEVSLTPEEKNAAATISATVLATAPPYDRIQTGTDSAPVAPTSQTSSVPRVNKLQVPSSTSYPQRFTD